MQTGPTGRGKEGRGGFFWGVGPDCRHFFLLRMYSNLFWSGYATYHGDIWQFCATLPASLVWLFFIVSAIRLLGQEEGDLAKGLEGRG